MPRDAFARRTLHLLVILLALLPASCNRADPHPAQIELSKDHAVGRDLPGNVYTPFDGVYPAQWPDFLRLPEGAYALGPISDETNPKAAEEQLQREMVAYALVQGDAVDLRLSYSAQLESAGYALVRGSYKLKSDLWTGQAYIQRPDGLWYGVVVKPISDTGREGWCALVITVSVHQDLSGQWNRAGGAPGPGSTGGQQTDAADKAPAAH